jgi:Fe2+ or Zn2+ uptake regulation protein
MYHRGSMTRPATSNELDTVSRARVQLRERGLRWTPQRRALVEVLVSSDGHVTGTDLVERCVAIDPGTTPSTVLPTTEHGHLRCEHCGATWEIDTVEAAQLTRVLARHRRFTLNLSHLTVVGRCAGCETA